MSYETIKTVENLTSLDRQLKAGRSDLNKELIFNRVRVLRSEGYTGDVALCIAMKEHNFTTGS